MTPRRFLGAAWPAWKHGLVTGVIIGSLGALLSGTNLFWPLQQSFDLWLLFGLRPAIEPPPDIAIVAIDGASAEQISLPRARHRDSACEGLTIGAVPATHERLPPPHLLMRWPRCVHALAVKALSDAGASVIALDISFRPLPLSPASQADDEALATAIREAGNVLIAQWLDATNLSDARADSGGEMLVQRPARISPAIESAVQGAGPMRLVYGLFGRVNGFATFSEEEAPISSMPALAFHLAEANAQADLYELIAAANTEAAVLVPRDAPTLLERKPLQSTSLMLRYMLRSDAQLSDALHRALQSPIHSHGLAGRHATVSTLVELYTGEAIRYLNFYGPPGSFPTVRYADLLADSTRGGGPAWNAVRGKTVIVGYVDLTTAQRDDHYPTVYTTREGVKLSGTEIVATALANIRTGSALRPPSATARTAIAFSFGLVLGPLLLAGPMLRGYSSAMVLWVAYLLLALICFWAGSVWLPILVPLFVQAPAGLLYGLVHNYRDMRLKRDRLRDLFGKFIPASVIEGLINNQAQLDTVSEPVYGVCLVTDAERFTTLADTMQPAQLARFLNDYFQVVFPRITEREGSIIDVLGDAVLAFWKGQEGDRLLHGKVCGAALELLTAVDRFNAASQARLPTRIGIASGQVTTTAMGAFNHYEFRPVGETVVTAFRLQDLNKMLGTRILACEPVVRAMEGLLVRELGLFQLRNKTSPTEVFEVIGERASANGELLALCEAFAIALALLHEGRTEAALEHFSALHQRYPDDGPAAFYVRWLSKHRDWGAGPIPQA